MERYWVPMWVVECGVQREGCISMVKHADAQRALDVEREKVKRLSTCGTDHSTPWWQVKCEDLEAQLATLQAQLPTEMPGCTILFKECEKGHGRLTATNWIDHGCGTCALEQLQAQLAAAQNEIDTATDQIPARMDGDSLSVALIKLKDAERDITNQMVAIQAQLRQVEGEKPDVGKLAVWEGIYEHFYAVDEIVRRDAFSQLLAFYKAATLAAQDAGEHNTLERTELDSLEGERHESR